jgi:hypothetical protein
MKPTLMQAIDHLAVQFGMSKNEVLTLMRVPTHPGGLRDEFAKAVAQAMEPPKFYVGIGETERALRTWASSCWAMADAMLEARNQ